MSHKTEAEIEHAKRINLPEFLQQQGFVLKKEGRDYRWRGIPGASVSIKDNANGEVGLWKQWSTGKGGTNIDFVMQFMDKRFAEAVDLLNGDLAISKDDIPPKQERIPPKPKPQEIHIDADTNSNRVKAYLSQTRGLHLQLVESLLRSGKIVQEKKTGNACFLIKDQNEKIIGAEKVGTSTFQKFKGIAENSASGYGFEICRGTGENLLFFESAIDALSFLQMHAKRFHHCRFISMMGVKPNVVVSTMERYGVPPEKVWLCADHDEAGNEFVKRLKAAYPQMHRLKTPEQFKDWNDQLRGIEKTAEKRKAPMNREKLQNSVRAIQTEQKEIPAKSKEKEVAR